jgi:hypothetical protein
MSVRGMVHVPLQCCFRSQEAGHYVAVDVRPGYGSPDHDDAAIAGRVVDFHDFAVVTESVLVSDECPHCFPFGWWAVPGG